MEEVIRKDVAAAKRPPNLMEYAAECARFSWEDARRALDGLPGGGLNMAHEAVDRHAVGARAQHLALRWLGRNGGVRDFTYADLSVSTSRFANVLKALEVMPGERVFVLAERIPELYFAVFGGLKHRCVVSPLFSAFGPEPIATRVAIGEGRVLVTTTEIPSIALARERVDFLDSRDLFAAILEAMTALRETETPQDDAGTGTASQATGRRAFPLLPLPIISSISAMSRRSWMA